MPRELRTVSDTTGIPILEIIKESESLTIFEADYMDRQIKFSVGLIPALIKSLSEFTEARSS